MDDINRMLSLEVQNYYGNQYQSFQKRVVDTNPLLTQDRERIMDLIVGADIHGDLLDVGAGNCQWFPAIEPTIDRYFALEANATALSLCPVNPKLFKILGNGFDTDFSFGNRFERGLQTVLFSFFLSHFTDSTISALLKKLQFAESLLIIDSYWGDIHKSKYVTKDWHIVDRKMSKQDYVELPKRFFDETDLQRILADVDFSICDFYRGNYWFGCFSKRNTKQA